MAQTEQMPPKGVAGYLYFWLFDLRHVKGMAQSLERWIAFLIILSLFAVVLEHIPDIEHQYFQELTAFDVFSIAIFTIEYALRVYTAKHHELFEQSRFPRLRYMVSFYALVDLIAIAPFYFSQFVTLDVEALRILRMLRLLRMFKFSRQLVPAWQEFQRLNQGRTFRQKVHALMEPSGHSGRLHFLVDNFIVFWIALSIFCVVVESIDSVRALFAVQFYWVDTLAFSLFSLEYLARLYAAPEKAEFKSMPWPRWEHIRGGQAVIDLLTILPFIFEHFLPFAIDLRFLRVFRLMRMLKFTRYTSATQTLFKVFRREWPVMAAALFVMMLLVVLMASVGYLVEHDAQPDKFPNIPVALYWAVITLASVGYGDISPITPVGRLLTVLTSLAGIGIFAVPAGLLASAFTDQLKLDREAFRRILMEAYKDGEINEQEHQEVLAEAERLHLSKSEFEKLVKRARQEWRERQEQAVQYGHLMLDVRQHPAYSSEQFGIIVAQMRLLHQVIGGAVLTQQLSATAPPNPTALALCQALSSAPHPSGGGA